MEPISAIESDDGRPAITDRASQTPLPPLWAIRAMTTFILLHFALIAISIIATVAPSGLQGRILDGAAWYLLPTHLSADGISIDVGRGDTVEQFHRVEVGEGPGESWVTWGAGHDPSPAIESAISGGLRQARWQRYLASVAMLGENQQSALAAWLGEPLAAELVASSAFRIVREPTLMTNVVQDSAEPPYTAAVVKDSRGVRRFVWTPPERLSAASTISGWSSQRVDTP